ncbi:MAG: DUF4838 domain-containing protein [Armatimonadota bacterium]
MRTLTALALVAATSCAMAAPLTIVEDGEARAAIVLQPDASEQLAEAVSEMQALIARASGAELPLVEQAPAGVVAIHVGRTPVVEALDPELGDLDGDGFVIEFPDAQSIVILGPTDWGTEFGVYEFLERYLGVRWLMPGDDGTYVPEMATIEVPDEAVRDEPAFFSRKYFGLRPPAQQLWARRNRLHSRIEFHHQLYKLFPHSDVEENPEFFPIRDGQRYFPPAETHYKGWQPCLTAPGIVDTAVERIVAHFDEHPEAESYSLGVTDGGRHCMCESCTALDPGRKNMVNRDHLTDRYITWANAVVEGVLAEHPDKWFGFLAYSEIFEPPDRVEMHPRLIPYMTYDRMQWIDPEARAAAEELTRRWADAAGSVGWYDYIYGASYLVPRVYPHVMGEYYRFAHENGVRGHTAEAYPNFGEGPKLYVSLRLQWDPTQDVDALLDEWYALAVGEDAAPHLRAYYDHWEDFWTRRILESEWYTRGRQYLPFHTPSYLEDVTADDIAQSRQWLEAAVADAGTEDQHARAELLLRAFEYYEASAIAYPRSEPTPELATEHDALGFLRGVQMRSEMAQKRRALSKETFSGHPFLHHGTDIDRRPAIGGLDWAASDVWTLFDWASRSEAVRDALADLTGADTPEGLRMHAETMLTTLDPATEPLNANSSFEEGDGAQAAGTSYWLQDGVGALIRSEEAASTGDFGIIAEGVQYGGPHQSVQFEPGRYCLVASVYLPEGQPEGGFIDLSLRTTTDENRNLSAGGTASITPTPGQWHTVATVMDATAPPDGAARIRSGVWARNFPPGKVVYFDDLRLIRLPD